MYLPGVNAARRKTRRQVLEFGGLNYTENIRDGELSDSRGLSCSAFPALGQRKGRHAVRQVQEGSAIFAWGKLCTVEGETLYYDGQVVGTVAPGKKQFAVVGSKLCIFPDKKYLDLTAEPKEFRSLGAKVVNREGTTVTLTEETLTMQPDVLLGTVSSHTQPIRPREVTTGVRTGEVHAIKVYDSVKWNNETLSWETEGEREIVLINSAGGGLDHLVGKYVILYDTQYSGEPKVNVKTLMERRDAQGLTSTTIQDYEADSQGRYGKIVSVSAVNQSANFYGEYIAYNITLRVEAHDGAASNESLSVFKKGDVVNISGCTEDGNNRDIKIVDVTDTTITFDSPVLTPGEDAGAVTVERRIPELDFICENGNRLCGVSNRDRTIYVSALGDPTNIFTYDGVATDSYAVVTGTDGAFTGCVAYSGGVLFFKENCVHRLVGDYPAEYAVYVDHIAGVQKGCEGSLVLVNEVLYYKGRDGVYAYAGATPRLISAPLGNVRYDKAEAGSDGNALYLSMRRQDTQSWELLTYDIRAGLWMKEDEREAAGFAFLDGVLYMLGGEDILALGQGEDDDGTPIVWEATFTPFTERVQERKYPSRLLLRLEMAAGAWADAAISRDGGPFKPLWLGHNDTAYTADIPIRPGRCDSYQIRLRGEGRCLIRSMAREFSLGGVK